MCYITYYPITLLPYYPITLSMIIHSYRFDYSSPYNLFLSHIDETWCSEFEGWPTTGSGATVTLPCSSGYVGNMNRTCSVDGVWLPVNMEGCALSTCPEEGVWPNTEPGVSGVVRECGEGFIGTMTRDCSPIGQWEPVDDSLCSTYCYQYHNYLLYSYDFLLNSILECGFV